MQYIRYSQLHFAMDPTENLGEIKSLTFEEFQKQLKTLRKDASDSTKKEQTYECCVENLKKRMDLLDRLSESLQEEQNCLKKIINEHGDNDEKKLEVMQAKSKLETNYLFKEIVEEEKKREDFYRKKAAEKCMEQYVEIKKSAHD
ncbi:hypothetical protein RRG08_038980 [Elysia crispata]|uniref:Uncharacterized protein n=1 Tax=Elysia crispata TaxID=231223 RepID=A0AAE0Y6W1_9GAST|nr:hypothetical protein RRG08_038980 [Elysia crispata]